MQLIKNKNKRNGHAVKPASRKREAGLAVAPIAAGPPEPPILTEDDRLHLEQAAAALREAEQARDQAGRTLLSVVVRILNEHGIDPETSGYRWNFDPTTLQFTVTGKTG